MNEVQPIVVVSQCLGFAAVRYDGQMLQDDFVEALQKHVRFVQVCPEVGVGLSVPRDPIRICSDKTGRHLVQPSTGRDLTESMRQFAASFLDDVGDVDGFILKSRSPSCGISDTKIFASADEQEPSMGKGPGLFAEAVLQRFPNAAIEDEAHLTSFQLRHHFLVKLFAVARLRPVKTMAALIRFHTEYKLQLMAYSPSGLYELGRIVANRNALAEREAIARYKEHFSKLTVNPAQPGTVRNALMHAFGYVSKQLAREDRDRLLESIKNYDDEGNDSRQATRLADVLACLRANAFACGQEYLKSQRFFEPYPSDLMRWNPTEKPR